MLRLTGLILCALLFGSAAIAAEPSRDPLQWLEAPKDPAAIAWAREQSILTRARLSVLPEFVPITRELGALLKAHDAPPAFTLLGSKIVRFNRDAAHPHGLLEVAERDAAGLPGPWRTVLDVGALRSDDGKEVELQWYGAHDLCLPPAYDRCLLRLSPGGGDEAALREFDLTTGEFVKGGFDIPPSRVQAAWISADRALVSSTFGGGPLTAAGWPAQVRLWRRGDTLASARVVAQADATDILVQLSAVGAGANRVGVIIRVIDFATYEFKSVDRLGAVATVGLPSKLKALGILAATDHDLVVQLAAPATLNGQSVASETVVAWDVRPQTPMARRLSVVFAPGGDDVINDTSTGIAATHNQVLLVVDRHLSKRIVTVSAGLQGWSARDTIIGAPGQTLTVPSADPGADDAILSRTGFLQPQSVVALRQGEARGTIYAEQPAFDASQMTVDIRSAKSRDGTTVDYYLVRPKTLAHPGATPTLITGYGAFGLSLAPGYLDWVVGGPGVKLWFERGGALVLPIIRGGGERGDAWHTAAMRENRQRSYDDFIAVAENLESTGFTTPKHVGVFGSSNGGLLAATVAVERPDLFGAVVSDVPLTDMLRFPKMGMGGAWTGEYGDPESPTARQALLKYSPYQNLQPGVSYPPFFITSSTEDNRVGPGHARKLAARLKEVGGDVFYYEDGEGGHGVSDALLRPDLMSMRMTFLIHTLMQP